MNKTGKLIGFILVGVAISAVTGAALEARRRNHIRSLLAEAANEGYETAYDIIDTNKMRAHRNRRLKYGPTLPKF